MDPLAQPPASTPAHDQPIEESPYWAEGVTLIVRKGATLPERCVRCNAPTDSFVKKNFRWHSPWLYVLLLPGVVFYVIAALILTRHMHLQIPLCGRHAFRYRVGRRLQVVGVVGILLLFVGMALYNRLALEWSFDPVPVLGIMVLLLLIGMVAGSFMTSIVKAERITETHVHLNADAAFLASCPDHWWSAEDEARDSEEWPTA